MTSLVDLTAEEIAAERERRRRGEDLADEARRLAGDFRDFIRSAWHVLEPSNPYVPNWHIDAMCDHLAAARAGEIRRLLINIPPRHMKSMTVAVFWPAWLWTTDPALRFLTASYADDAVTRDTKKSRRLLTSDWFRRHWPTVELLRDANRVDRYENTATGHRVAATVGGKGGTGEGGDVLILDDPQQPAVASSAVQRQKAIDWYRDTLASRFNDPRTYVQIVIMQRLHENDLAGYLLEQGGWTHLCVPARYEPTHPFLWPDDPRTTEGELLWPERLPGPELDALAANMTSHIAAGQLQQRPAPREGAILKRQWWRTFDPAYLDPDGYGKLPPGLPAFRSIVHSWDTAFKAKTTSDYVAGQVWGVNGADRYLLRAVRARLTLAETAREMTAVREWALGLWPRAPHHMLIEKSANGVEIIESLRREITGVLPVVASTDKVTRAEAAAADLESGNCYVPGVLRADGEGPESPLAWVGEFLEEAAAFPFGAHDDQVDAFTQAINWARGRASGPGRISRPTIPLRTSRPEGPVRLGGIAA